MNYKKDVVLKDSARNKIYKKIAKRYPCTDGERKAKERGPISRARFPLSYKQAWMKELDEPENFFFSYITRIMK